MSGRFLQSTAKNFLKLRYGLDKVVLKLQSSFQQLVANKKESLCKKNNNDLQKRIRAIVKQLQATIKIVKSILTVLQRLLKFIKFLKKLILGLTILVKVLKLLPIPGMFSTVGLSTTMSDLLAKVGFKLKAGLLLVAGIDFIVSYMAKSLTVLIKKIGEIIDNLRAVATNLLECSKTLQIEGDATSSVLRAELYNELNSSLDELTQAVDDLNDQFGGLINSSNSYRGFTFVVIEEDINFNFNVGTSNQTSAKRRYAVALNSEGSTVLQGGLSFATDTQVLIDELKLKIDNGNLTGFANIKDTFAIDDEGNFDVNTGDEETDALMTTEIEELDTPESEILEEMGIESIEEIENDSNDSKNDINELINSDDKFKKLKSKYAKKQKKFVKFLEKKSKAGNNRATELLNKYNSGQVSLDDLKTEWLEGSAGKF